MRVLLAGNPNAGKTTLFNALSGAKAHVANYPGVTVERRSASIRLSGIRCELIDVPGTYSLSARSLEEQVAARELLPFVPKEVDAQAAHTTQLVVAVVDATALTRNLYLALQVIETGVPVVIALNMVDLAERNGLSIDAAALQSALGCPVVPISAAQGHGLETLKAEMVRALDRSSAEGSPRKTWPARVDWGSSLAADVDAIAAAVSRDNSEGDASKPPLPESYAWARWALLSADAPFPVDSNGASPGRAAQRAIEQIRARADEQGRDLPLEIISARYRFLEHATAQAIRRSPSTSEQWTERADRILTHRVWGFAIFGLLMLVLLEGLFRGSEPAIESIESMIAALQSTVGDALPPGPFQSLLIDGVIAGVGNVVVFVPQIALLFFVLAFLEDSGYLARVAFVIDRAMAGIGLHGKAFVPLLSGFACAVPAVLATRTIESRRDRLVTMLALPLMSCSARLPVYVLVIGTVFAGSPRVFGILSMGAVMLGAMYAGSLLTTLAAAAVIKRTVLQGPRPPFILELPPYRMPRARNLWLATWRRVRTFLTDAGTIILAFTIVLWALLSFPKSETIAAEYSARRSVATADAEIAQLDAEEAALQLRHSVGGRIGIALEPALQPLGFDWRLGVGILGAFAAREVFVSTLGIVFGIADSGQADSGQHDESLRAALRRAKKPNGAPLMTPLAGVSLMVFFLLACQCMSTLAVVQRESGSWRWPLFLFAYMTALAYASSLLVYQVGRALLM